MRGGDLGDLASEEGEVGRARGGLKNVNDLKRGCSWRAARGGREGNQKSTGTQIAQYERGEREGRVAGPQTTEGEICKMGDAVDGEQLRGRSKIPQHGMRKG